MTGSGREESSVRDIVNLLFARILDLLPEGLGSPPFNRGCTDGSLVLLEQELGVSLPEDYRAFLRCANGQPDHYSLTFPPGELTFLSVEEVFTLWQGDLPRRDDELFDDLMCGDQVRSIAYHPGRVPIAVYESATEYLCIDNIPGPQGRIGQLIFNTDEAEWAVVEANFETLMRRYVTMLEEGMVAIEKRSSEASHGYHFTFNGSEINFDVYEELKTL